MGDWDGNVSLEVPHPRVDDDKQTQNLDHLKRWGDEVKGQIDDLVAAATPDATGVVKGKLKLAGDLSGTADLPTVPGLAGKVDVGSPSLVPVGTVFYSAAAATPTGYVLCDGGLLLQADYPALFAALGGVSSPFGVVGPYFNVPNLINVFIRGSTSQGGTGGNDTATLTPGQLPSHTHGPGTLVNSAGGIHSHEIKGSSASNTSATGGSNRVVNINKTGSTSLGYTVDSSSHTHNISGLTGYTGGGDPVPTIPSYVTLRPIIKT